MRSFYYANKTKRVEFLLSLLLAPPSLKKTPEREPPEYPPPRLDQG